MGVNLIYMNFLIISIILTFVLIMLFNTYFIAKNHKELDSSDMKKANLILKIVRISPIIVLSIMLIVIGVYLKTKFIIRLSHAWVVMQFWIFSTLFYVTSILIRSTKKSAMILSVIAMLLSVWIAIYLTPLNHYENLLNNISIIIANILGFIMLGVAYFVIIVLQKEL